MKLAQQNLQSNKNQMLPHNAPRYGQFQVVADTDYNITPFLNSGGAIENLFYLHSE